MASRSARSNYKALLNDASINNDSGSFADLTVSNTLTITGAQIDSLPVDNTTIQYSSYQLAVKDGGISNAKLASLSVATGNIQNSAITNDKIADNTIQDAKIVSLSASKLTGALPAMTSISTDAIYEKTTNNGVWIDYDVLIKDGIVNCSGVSSTTLTANNINTIAPATTLNLCNSAVSVDTSGSVFCDNISSAFASFSMFSTDEISPVMNDYITINNIDLDRFATLSCSSITAGQTRNFLFPDASGTLALTSSIPDTSGMLTQTNTVSSIINKTFIDSSTKFSKSGEPTALMRFSLTNITAGAERVITIPNYNLTLASQAGTETLTNKTLTTPIIASIKPSASYTHTVPDITDDTLTLNNATQTLQNKSLRVDTCKFIDSADSTKKIGFNCSLNATNCAISISSQSSAGGDVYYLPDLLSGSDTFVMEQKAQTMTNKSLQDSTTYFIDNSDNTKKLQFQLSGITTGTTRTLTAPNNSGTILLDGIAGNITFSNALQLVAKSSAQTVLTSTNTAITFDNTNLTNGPSYYVNGTSTTQWKNTSGRTQQVLFTYSICCASNSSAYRITSWLNKNGGSAATDRFGACEHGKSTTTSNIKLCGSVVVSMANNDYFELYVWHNRSGSSLDVGGNTNDTYSSMSAFVLSY